MKNFLKSEKFIVILLCLVAFLLRVPFISPWLGDWDSVQFALGIHNFSIPLHQPHPPGYPLYILLGKLFFIFFRSDGLALTSLSILFGSLVVIPFYFLTRKMFNKRFAILSSILFILIPVEWILSEIPVSNIPGFFMLMTFGYLVYVFIDNNKKLLLIGLFSGLILGVRFTDIPVILGIWGLVVVRNLIIKHDFKFFGLLVCSFFLGIAIWLIPTILITGFGSFITSTQDTATYVTWHDMQLGRHLPIGELILTRISYLWGLLKIAFTPYLLFVSLLGVFLLSKHLRKLGEFRYQFLLMWLFSYGMVLIFYYNLELAQYTLPLLPPLVIFTAFLLDYFWQKKMFQLLSLIIFVMMIIVVVNTSWPQIEKQARTVPTSILPVLYIKANFNPQNTTLITSFTYRQFQYYAPEFKNYYTAKNAPGDIQTEFVVVDYKGLKDQIPGLSNYRIIDIKKYSQEDLLFSRLNETSLYILKRI